MGHISYFFYDSFFILSLFDNEDEACCVTLLIITLRIAGVFLMDLSFRGTYFAITSDFRA